MNFIHYCKPSITQKEIDAATHAAQDGWGKNAYTYINQFETSFRSFLGCRFAIATSSCTGALHMGLAALDIGPGDEVILADTNWIATVAPIHHLGATPVFVDISPISWCIDPQKVEAAITKKTKAIVATHLYGNLCDMAELSKIASQYNIAIIEDAAEAIGSMYHGKYAGTMGLFGTFSFHGSKTITTGEGGMFVTDDEQLYDRVLMLSHHGRSPKQTRQFWPEVVGFKYRMSNLQAAIGCAQMERIEDLIKRKRDILAYYKAHIDLPMNPESEHEINGAWMPTVILDSSLSLSGDSLIQHFKSHNIDARTFFHPLTSLPMFEGHQVCPIAKDIASRGVNLPSYHDITNNELDYVIATLNSLLTTSV